MKKALIFPLAALALMLGGCGMDMQEVTVWRAVADFALGGGSAVAAEVVRVDGALGAIDAAAEALNTSPGDAELSNPLPEDAAVLGWELAGSELRCSVASGYAALTGRERTTADCCITLTFCAVEGVESVSIYSGGVMLSAAMEPEDFILADSSGITE